MNDFYQLVILYAKAGREEELRRLLVELVEPSRREEGNLRYEFFIDESDPRRFIFVEHWADPESQHKHHAHGDHILEFEARKDELVEKVELFYRMKSVS